MPFEPGNTLATGGAREGAGRKSKAEKYATPIAEAEQRCADQLPERLSTLEQIANGEVKQTKEIWAAAATITRDAMEIGPDGKSHRVKILAFPELPGEELVLVGKEEMTFAPDKIVNMYLADRVMGKPASGDEEKVKELVREQLDGFIAKIRRLFDPATAERILSTLATDDPGSSGEGNGADGVSDNGGD